MTRDTNWHGSNPDKDVNQRNGVVMYHQEDGKWADLPALSTPHVLCELVNVFVLRSKLIEHTEQSNANFSLLESQANDMATELEFLKNIVVSSLVN